MTIKGVFSSSGLSALGFFAKYYPADGEQTSISILFYEVKLNTIAVLTLDI